MYRIADFDRLQPFMITVTSPDDHWLFVSTTGGLTCGRVDPSRALFPYETDDRLHRAGGLRGPVTALRVAGPNGETPWAPLRGAPGAGVTRSLYRSPLGDRLVFEEVNDDLGLTLRTRWTTSRTFGFVRTATLSRHPGLPAVDVTLLDGVLDLLPALVPLPTRQAMSNLVDAYTRCERLAGLPLVVCSLEARIVDRPEPAEALRANIVWSVGLDGATVSLDEGALADFERGVEIDATPLLTGRRGACLQRAHVTLADGAALTWHLVGDVHVEQRGVAAVVARLADPDALAADIAADVAASGHRLRQLVGSVDGLQLGADRVQTTAHGMNALFNAMRGGVFTDGHSVPVQDLAVFLRGRSPATWARQAGFLGELRDDTVDTVVAAAAARQDPDLLRLVYEYLPLWFSRRHGDPSRPWNTFTIRGLDSDGRRGLDWQGNWRDIFQNWETLCESFPGFAPSVVVTFLDASSADGGNPYRVSRAGMDWEVPDPEDPWSHIGYWGDHQIIYLLRLLELAQRVRPGHLEALADAAIFTYADIPYRLAPYADLLDDPHDTITFDAARQREVEARVGREGADGRLLRDAWGEIVRVTLAEKLLVPALAKICNLVVDGGVWMNTQRPEWNDANNALVGWGLSVVTAAHLRRYCATVPSLLAGRAADVRLSAEVAAWLDQVRAILRTHRAALARPDVGDAARQTILDDLAGSFSGYRAALYEDGLSPQVTRPVADLLAVFDLAREFLDHTLRANRREDGLYHSYNVMVRRPDGAGIGIGRLPLMLEGQVALLDSGLVAPEEAADMLDGLFASALYRPDQRSFILYPSVERPSFLDKNAVEPARATAIGLLATLLERGDTRIVARDTHGTVRFQGDLANARDLAAALDRLAAEPNWAARVAADREAVLALWEEVFQHRFFTGRSGTMYGYEGIGCIYWHMVSKLHLAALGAHRQATVAGANATVVGRLADRYHAIRAGLGPAKTPATYGAFPTDPHSYTPAHRGAQQPGMTGQAKETVLVRWRELGVRVAAGRLCFAPELLPLSELLAAPESLAVIDVHGAEQLVPVPAGGLAFTYCQVPIVYSGGDGAADAPVEVSWWWADGRSEAAEGGLNPAASAAVLTRSGAVVRIEVSFPRARLWRG